MEDIFKVEKGNWQLITLHNYIFLLTEGVVDDLKQSKVAGCHTVHS